MALFGEGSTLEDALGAQADNAAMNIESQYAKKRRQAIGQQAKAGRLGSGVANYTFGDIDAAQIGELGDVQSGLAEALGQIPANDYVSGREDQRQRELVQLIAKLSNKRPSMWSRILGGGTAGAQAGGSVGGPWGAVVGGVGGGLAGMAS